MKRPPSKNKAGVAPEDNEMIQAAAEWRTRHDAGLAPGEEAVFVRWLEADERHAQLFTQMDATWEILDRASELAPEKLEVPHPRTSATAGSRRSRSRLSPNVFTAVLAIAAAITIMGAVSWWQMEKTLSYAFADTVSVGPDVVQRLNLPDGSIVRLNSASKLKVQFSANERRVLLEQGEASFTVAKDVQRPFIVTTAGVDVRAVGTIFNVVRRSESVEVLVTEGKVRVDDSVRGGSLLTTALAPSATDPKPGLIAGEKVVISVRADAPAMAVSPVVVPVEEIARVLAWQDRRLEFDSAPLNEIAAEFNRYNQHKLLIADPALGLQRFGGSFRADDPDTFVHLIETRSGVVVEQRSNETILRLAK